MDFKRTFFQVIKVVIFSEFCENLEIKKPKILKMLRIS